MTQRLDKIASFLGGAKKTNNGYDCKCPLHDDKTASLSIKDSDDKVLVYCHAGCSGKEILAYLRQHNLIEKQKSEFPRKLIEVPAFIKEYAEQFDKTPPPPASLETKPRDEENQTANKVVATYDYTDETGALVKRVFRFSPKGFRQQAANGSWSTAGLPRYPYKLPEVLKAIEAGQEIIICEGEKDVHFCNKFNFTATTNCGGALKWSKDFGHWFKGARVVLVPDHDEVGERHMSQVAESLKDHADSIKWLFYPKKFKDLSDTKIENQSDFETMISNAVPVMEESIDSQKEPLVYFVEDATSQIKPIRWQIENFLEQDAITQIYGPPASGKSFVAISMAASVATGTPWFGNEVKKGLVVYIAGEGHNGIIRRLAAWERANQCPLKRGQFIKSYRAISIMDKNEAHELVSQVEALAQNQSPSLVVIDTVARSFGAGDENSTKDMNQFVEHVDRYIRKRFNCNVLLVHHSGHTEGRARGSSALKAAVDAEYQVSNENGVVTLTATKMKDAELPPELNFKMTRVELGIIEERLITSVVLSADFNGLDIVIVKENSQFEPVTFRAVATEIDRFGWKGMEPLAETLKISKAALSKGLKRIEAVGLISKISGGGYALSDKTKALMSLRGADVLKGFDSKNSPPVFVDNKLKVEH